jgi:hypothetical protein
MASQTLRSGTSSAEAAAVRVNFTETVTAPVTLTLTFALPNASDPVVLGALQREVIAAALEATGASNATVTTTLKPAADGSTTVTMVVLATFRASIESSTTIPAAAYAVDPKGSSDAAVKAASNGPAVAQAAASLSLAATRAAADAAAFANGTILTGSPKVSLASRLAATSGGRLNETRLATSASAIVGAVTVETTVAPAQAAAGLAAAPASAAGAVDFNYSLASAMAFAAMSLGAGLVWLRWRQRAVLSLPKLPPAQHTTHYNNPLLEGNLSRNLKRSARTTENPMRDSRKDR